MTRKSSLTGGQVWVVRQGSRRVGHIARNAGGVLEARPGPVKRETVCGLRFVLGNDHQGGVWRFQAEPGDNVCATCWNERAVAELGLEHATHLRITETSEGLATKLVADAVRPWDEGKGNSGRSVKGGKR
jgi:hypothetical protein